jgi:flagellar biosynthetic protein FlhB
MAQQERTEKATVRRRQRAREEGQFAYSQELTSVMTLAAGAGTVFYYILSPASFRNFLAGMLQNATAADNTLLIRQAAQFFLVSAAPVFVAAVVAALAAVSSRDCRSLRLRQRR